MRRSWTLADHVQEAGLGNKVVQVERCAGRVQTECTGPYWNVLPWTFRVSALICAASHMKDVTLFSKNESYTPAEAKRALEQLDQLVADKTITARQAGAYRRHVFSHVRLSLKPEYTAQAAKRAKTEIVSSRKQARSRSRLQRPTGRTSPSVPWRPKPLVERGGLRTAFSPAGSADYSDPVVRSW
jgi:hypothetical protein